MTQDDPGSEPSDAGLRATLSRLTASPWFTWGERLVWIGVLVFVAVRLGPQLSALTGLSLPAAHPVEGTRPVWAVRTLDGTSLSSEELRGRVVVVNFWATWCPPCRLEVPSLQKLWEERRGEGLVVVGLSRDQGGRGVVEAFLDERGVTYPVALADRDLVDAFGGTPGLPTTLLLDREGRVRHRVYGYFTPPALRAAVGRLLDEEPAISAGTASGR
jgi:thiol-disulfide isomerase/thioredoxin